MEALMILRPVILISLLTVAAVTDILRHRVSNCIIAAGFILEATVHLVSGAAVDNEALSLSVLFVIFVFMLFVLRLIGGADVKLYALCVFTYPNETGLKIISLSVFIAAFYAVYVAARFGTKGRFTRLCRYMSGIVSTGVSAGTAGAYIEDLGAHDAKLVPMAAFICAGAILAVMQSAVC